MAARKRGRAGTVGLAVGGARGVLAGQNRGQKLANRREAGRRSGATQRGGGGKRAFGTTRGGTFAGTLAQAQSMAKAGQTKKAGGSG